MEELKYCRHFNRKTKEGGKHPDRDAQFEYINAKAEAFQAADQPVISIDSKKKELLGEFKNGGSDYGPQGQPIEVNTHDFEDKELGKFVPYGIYDTGANLGYVSLGIDHDTGQFAVKWRSPLARSDGPGALSLDDASHDHRRWRRLQRLAPTAVEGGAATTRRRDRPDHPGLPLSAGDLEVEQDRAPHVLPHYPELARHASRQPPRGHRTDRKHHDENRSQNPLRTRSQPLSQGHQDLRRANGDTQHKAAIPSIQNGTTASRPDVPTWSNNSWASPNYTDLLEDDRFINSLWVSFEFVATAVVVEFLLGFSLAFLFNAKLPGLATLRKIAILPIMVMPLASGLIWFYILNENFGALNWFAVALGAPERIPFLTSDALALRSIVLADAWQWTPFVMLVIFAALQSIPEYVYEAAKTDGLYPWQTFWRVTLPLLRPAIWVVVVLRVVDAFRMIELIYLMTRGGPAGATETLSWYIYSTGFLDQDLGSAAAQAVGQKKAIAIAVRNVSGRRRWSKLDEWLRDGAPSRSSNSSKVD